MPCSRLRVRVGVSSDKLRPWHEYDADVIGPSVLVGRRDQSSRDSLRVAVKSSDDRCRLARAKRVAQPVGAKQERRRRVERKCAKLDEIVVSGIALARSNVAKISFRRGCAIASASVNSPWSSNSPTGE